MEKKTEQKTKAPEMSAEVKANPLRNERIYVRFVPKVDNLPARHPLSGGKADGTETKLCVPFLPSTETYKNPLTKEEKDFLEERLGLDHNALSVYNKTKNYWDNNWVVLTKEGIHLDLSNPEDYIKYKILLLNSDIVAPSVQERIDRPKATYRYEIVREHEETAIENVKMDATMASYREFGKIENDIDTMRVLVELLDGRPYSQNESSAFFRARINALIQQNPRVFLNNITDPLLHTKVIIRRAQELGKITKRGDYYYLASDKSPLCDNNENPTLPIAARYLNQPAHMDIKFLLESEINKAK